MLLCPGQPQAQAKDEVTSTGREKVETLYVGQERAVLTKQISNSTANL